MRNALTVFAPAVLLALSSSRSLTAAAAAAATHRTSASMAWFCSADTNDGLVDNLKSRFLRETWRKKGKVGLEGVKWVRLVDGGVRPRWKNWEAGRGATCAPPEDTVAAVVLASQAELDYVCFARQNKN